ncbi:MAG: saccharopine dehydrogenase NADP-binding domain-containing protein [Desulfohalobiaceae bacterium]|nr:saccharopine dehydrogenase NADP-binding domain-containing protein [Desulfohalobiaceae bacterium]
MKILCLGGAGQICREAIHDLVAFSDASRITIADIDETAVREIAERHKDPRVGGIKLDIKDREKAVRLMRDYDLVMDGLTISLNDLSTSCMAEAGVHGINLNGCTTEWDYEQQFRERKKVLVPGMGMTPGITNLMAKYAADRLDTVNTIRISHGAFRPIAFSPSIAETTRMEYDPDLPTRLVFEEGEYIQVPPFARPRKIELPAPFGTHIQYIIPHAETLTLPKTLADKNVRLVEVRGTWPPENMELLKVLFKWGFLRNDRVRLGREEIGILDAIAAYLLKSPEGRRTKLYGYALHVEVSGEKDGTEVLYVLTHTHPPSDGSVPGWKHLRAYTRNVGIPMSIGVQMISKGQVKGSGVMAPELAFDPGLVFQELAKRHIRIHDAIKPL